jgi:hypothetical protein
MESFDNKFTDYLRLKQHYDITPSVTKKLDALQSSPITPDNLHTQHHLHNLIFYGPPGVGKYASALHFISKHSPSKLAYDKKMLVESQKGDFNIRMSDIHFEVDMSLLGCNSKQVWSDIYVQIINVTAIRPSRTAIILCKGFDKIHSEFLEVFHSFMQTTKTNMNIKFILLTEAVSFIPSIITDRCLLINVPRPSRTTYAKLTQLKKGFDVTSISNIKSFKEKIDCDPTTVLVDDIVKFINPPIATVSTSSGTSSGTTTSTTTSTTETTTNVTTATSATKFDFEELRRLLYEIYVRNLNVAEIMWKVTTSVLTESLNAKYEHDIVKQTCVFVELLNNNYRPIYHLERYICFLITCIHEL